MSDEPPLSPDEIRQAIETLKIAGDNSDGMSAAIFKDAKSNLVGESYPLCGELVTDSD
jgi:hypothetical protein